MPFYAQRVHMYSVIMLDWYARRCSAAFVCYEHCCARAREFCASSARDASIPFLCHGAPPYFALSPSRYVDTLLFALMPQPPAVALLLRLLLLSYAIFFHIGFLLLMFFLMRHAVDMRYAMLDDGTFDTPYAICLHAPPAMLPHAVDCLLPCLRLFCSYFSLLFTLHTMFDIVEDICSFSVLLFYLVLIFFPATFYYYCRFVVLPYLDACCLYLFRCYCLFRFRWFCLYYADCSHADSYAITCHYISPDVYAIYDICLCWYSCLTCFADTDAAADYSHVSFTLPFWCWYACHCYAAMLSLSFTQVACWYSSPCLSLSYGERAYVLRRWRLRWCLRLVCYICLCSLHICLYFVSWYARWYMLTFFAFFTRSFSFFLFFRCLIIMMPFSSYAIYKRAQRARCRLHYDARIRRYFRHFDADLLCRCLIHYAPICYMPAIIDFDAAFIPALLTLSRWPVASAAMSLADSIYSALVGDVAVLFW